MVMFVKKEKCWYDACPKQRGGRQCNKKVLPCGADDLDGPFRCEACNVEMEQCQRRYILGLNILDHSGQTWATAFNDEGEKLLNGMTADELNLIMQSDHAKFNDILQGIIMKPMQLTLRVKVETVNDEQRVKASIQSSEPIDFVRESKRLLEGIQGLLM
jgi:replication factor A1